MNEPRQKQFLAIGKEGCLFLSILHLAEDVTHTYIDAYVAYLDALAKKLITERCYVNDLGRTLSFFTKEKWTCRRVALSDATDPREGEITRYRRTVSPTETVKHFVVTDGADMVIWDPLGSSETVKFGTPDEKYIFTRSAE